jgi:hypothetical protein
LAYEVFVALVVVMTYDTVELLHVFRGFLKDAEQGATIPSVGAEDLRSLHELCVERAKRYCGKDGVISLEATAQACSSGANVPAVWLRHTQLRALYRQGMLAEWQHGTKLVDDVFLLAATIPMSGVQLDQERFVRELREKTPGLSVGSTTGAKNR